MGFAADMVFDRCVIAHRVDEGASPASDAAWKKSRQRQDRKGLAPKRNFS
jgi:hypothetical protein